MIRKNSILTFTVNRHFENYKTVTTETTVHTIVMTLPMRKTLFHSVFLFFELFATKTTFCHFFNLRSILCVGNSSGYRHRFQAYVNRVRPFMYFRIDRTSNDRHH